MELYRCIREVRVRTRAILLYLVSGSGIEKCGGSITGTYRIIERIVCMANCAEM
jgi:hypothetical protein